jgi:organic hydroperoxide reductase OsmC/OhrA
MSIVKALRFPVSVRWRGGRLTGLSAAGKPDLEVATPPEFRGGVTGVWSPEDLLVASTATCFAVTLVAIAERMDVPLRALEVTGTGHVSKRDDGRFGFVAIELDVALETSPERVETAERAAELAEERCLVSMALDIPVHVALAARSEGEHPTPLRERSKP